MFAVGYTCCDGNYVVATGDAETLQALGVDAFELLDRESARGSGGDTSTHQSLGASPRRLVLVGLGTGTCRDYRRAGAAVSRLARGLSVAACSVGATADDDQLAAFCEGLVLGGFEFSQKSQPESPTPLRLLLTGVEQSRQLVVQRASVHALASWRSRAYAITPSNQKSPQQLATWAREAAVHGGLDFEVWDEERLAADGMAGILAVGAGSVHDSRLVRLDYRPSAGDRTAPRVVLVGKGITFDTGGISIKPRDAMMTMKRDMTGAGVVIAVMRALRELDVRVPVTGLIAAAENAFGGAAMRPGDVVTHFGGRTSEIGDTDAEGRLVLADALAYADATLAPDVVVDIATLTGAGKVAVGTSLGALFANDDDLAAQLTAAGVAAGEPVWRMPLSEEYEPLLESAFADATNAAGRPGAVTAALYLQHFAGQRRWAHLDIASVGDSPHDAYEYTKGATGFGSRLLLYWLSTLSADR